eukprot:TRINITY_DN1661_c0_g1_i2.p1 TRINITY_DN1661_c0_g1~~TRINITY_DN1661_c0_g1_i2.p1  ORF type:complete len:516 (+),score=216.37 TRINITY_DN1661_c0_g1_i2:97-1644(+)
MPFWILHESASGYGLFERAEAEEIATSTDEIQTAIQDFKKFNKMVQNVGFMPFQSTENALENINAISEGIVPELLKSFIEMNLPKKKKVTLGVVDDKLATALQEAIPGIKCEKSAAVAEIIRGIRLHFDQYIKELKNGEIERAQLGLGHAYSRAKVKFNIHRVDNMIIQSISLLDQMDKDLNTFAMRCREWYSWHFPELVRVVPDNYQFAKLACLIKNKGDLTQDSLSSITDALDGDEEKAQAVLDAAKASMGTDISEVDMNSIEAFAKRVVSLSEYRTKLFTYLQKKMHDVAPNLSALMGEQVGARLISHAGSLTNLAKYPASTVQILGAEKALFRALKTRSNTPKYGLIYHSTFIGRASTKNKGRISRYLANKASIASRIDSFSDGPQTSIFGEKLREQVEERLRFYDTGAVPKKNLDVMREAIAQLPKEDEEMEAAPKTPKADKKKEKESKSAKKESKSAKKDDKKAESAKKKRKEASSSEDESSSSSSEEEKKKKKKSKKEDKKDKKKSKK